MKKQDRPTHNAETKETNVENLFIAGVIAAGNNANEIFIEKWPISWGGNCGSD